MGGRAGYEMKAWLGLDKERGKRCAESSYNCACPSTLKDAVEFSAVYIVAVGACTRYRYGRDAEAGGGCRLIRILVASG